MNDGSPRLAAFTKSDVQSTTSNIQNIMLLSVTTFRLAYMKIYNMLCKHESVLFLNLGAFIFIFFWSFSCSRWCALGVGSCPPFTCPFCLIGPSQCPARLLRTAGTGI